MIRRFGEPARADKRYQLRPGAYAILWNGADMLVTFQAEPLPEIQLPGGGIDAGESAVCALHREVIEETGWAISNPRKLGAFRRFTYMPEYDLWAEKLCHIYLARPVLRRCPPSEPAHEPIWTTPTDAIRLLANEGDSHFVGQLFGLTS